MSAMVKIADIWSEVVSEYILEQYRGAENWKAILKCVVDKYGEIEDNAWKLASILDFKCRTKADRPSGTLLDFCAGIVNIYRRDGETDAHFYQRFALEVGMNNAGTPDAVIYGASVLSGSTVPQYMDEAPATFLVFTGPSYDHDGNWNDGGRQLSFSQVRKMAPAGVLGIPCVGIDVGDGTVLGTYAEDESDRQAIMLNADDSQIERELVLADNNGALLLSSGSQPIRVIVHGSSVPDIPVIETTWNGVPVDAVRIKDLPDAGYEDAYMVRDSDVGGTSKIDEDEVGLQIQPSGTNTITFFKRN